MLKWCSVLKHLVVQIEPYLVTLLGQYIKNHLLEFFFLIQIIKTFACAKKLKQKSFVEKLKLSNEIKQVHRS